MNYLENELQGCQSLEGKHVNSLFDGMTCDCPAYRIADQGDPVPVVSAGCDSNRMYLFIEGTE